MAPSETRPERPDQDWGSVTSGPVVSEDFGLVTQSPARFEDWNVDAPPVAPAKTVGWALREYVVKPGISTIRRRW